VRTLDSRLRAQQFNLGEQAQRLQRALEIPVQAKALQHLLQDDVSHQNLLPAQGRLQIIRFRR
jgi:hypothetical protein